MTAGAGRVLPPDGRAQLPREAVGGKAWRTQRMMSLGSPVPPAFVVTTDVCREDHRHNRSLPADIWGDVAGAMVAVEQHTGRRFGVPERPLLVSVRSGAAISMPGMMDTVLNLG